MNIYFSYLFCLLLYNIDFRLFHGEKIMQVSFCNVHSAVYRMKLQIIKSAVCHGSTILSADIFRRLNHAHKSWPTLSIVWHLLYYNVTVHWNNITTIQRRFQPFG